MNNSQVKNARLLCSGVIRLVYAACLVDNHYSKGRARKMT